MQSRSLPIAAIAAALLAFLPAAAPSQTTRLRLMAANTTSGNNQSYDPGHGIRIFQGLDPDIVMIQEFKYGSNSSADLRAFVDLAFGPEFHYFREAQSGGIPNGIVSRYPIIQSGEFNDTNVSDRDFPWARIDIPGDRDLWVFSVHFLTTGASDRNSQATLLVNSIATLNIPSTDYVSIGGDFNTDNRTESCITTLGARVVTGSPYPADNEGNGNTNAGRSKPYDWVLVNNNLHALRTAVLVGNSSFANGLVFDSRVYTPLSEVAPVQSNDSGATNMQHMAVVRDFLIPTTGATSTPTATPSPSATGATPTATSATPTAATPTASPTQGSGSVAPGEVLINEIDYDDTAADDLSFIELLNVSGRTINLSALDIVGTNGNGTTTYFQVPLPSVNLAPGEYYVLGTGTDSGGLPGGTIDYTLPGVDVLQNGANDGVYLRLGASPSVIIDSVSYEGSAAHPTGATDSGDAGTDSGIADDQSLSRFPNGADSNVNSADFAIRPPTPGASNGGTLTPTPSPTATVAPTASASPSATATISPTATASPSLSPFPSAEPTATATLSPTETAATPTATDSPTPTAATATPSPSASESASPTPSATDTPTETATATPSPTAEPVEVIPVLLAASQQNPTGADRNGDGVVDGADVLSP